VRLNEYGGRLAPGIDLDAVIGPDYGFNPLEANLVGVDEMAAMEPPEPLVDGVLSQGSFAVLYGQPASGKSFVALDWAMSIGAGLPWQGREVRGGPVIYVVGEGLRGMANRARAWVEHFGPDIPPEVYFHKGAINLTSEAQTSYLAKLAEDKKASLVIIDTLARSLSGGDENTSTTMGKTIEGIGKVQQHGAAVLVVHHTSKGGELRGHSSLAGAADHIIRAWRPENDHSGLVFLYSNKAKDDEEFAHIRLRLHSVQVEYGSSCVVLAG